MKFIPALTLAALLMVSGRADAQAPAAGATPTTPTSATPAAPATTANKAAATPATAPAEKTVEVNVAATISLIDGEVTIYTAERKKRAVKVGDHLSEGESVVTGKDGELHLEMEDGGFISVRPNTKLRITKYQAKGESTDSVVIGLLQGGLRSVTGWIGKFNRENYTIRTPTATVGVRGTDHEPYVIPAGSAEGDPGTYDRVHEGGSVLKTAGGSTDIGANQSGYASPKKERPRVLAEHPRFYRVMKNDHVFKTKHAEVQARIEKRREERRSAIRDKIAKGKADADSRKAARQLAIKEKREAAQKRREEAKVEKREAKAEKQEAKQEAKSEAEEAKARRERPRLHREPR